jgi:hypothetical protein
MRQRHAEDGVARLQQRQVHGLVGLRARMRLHVGVVGAEQLLAALDRQPLGHIHVLATAVVALARIALGVLVGEHRTLRFQHARTGVVLGGNQLDVVFLTPALVRDGLGQFGVECFNSRVAWKHGGLQRWGRRESVQFSGHCAPHPIPGAPGGLHRPALEAKASAETPPAPRLGTCVGAAVTRACAAGKAAGRVRARAPGGARRSPLPRPAQATGRYRARPSPPA